MPTLSASLAPTTDPIKPITPVEPIAQIFVDLTTNLSGPRIRLTLRTNPTISGLINIIIVTLEQEMTGQKINILLSQAEQSSAIAVPAGWRAAKGSLDMTMLPVTLFNPS